MIATPRPAPGSRIVRSVLIAIDPSSRSHAKEIQPVRYRASNQAGGIGASVRAVHALPDLEKMFTAPAS
jgi:hypothetical protein